jgi:excinuclease UvrABC ATPase subunit
MKKNLSRCAGCGEDSSILMQVSSGPEVILLCSDCHNLKYSKEVQNEINYVDEEKS